MRSALSLLLRPGVRLMRRLRVPAKVGLIGLMLFVPMVLLLASSLRNGLAQIASTQAEHDGADVVRRLLDLTGRLQAHQASSQASSQQGSNGTSAAAAHDLAARELIDALAIADAGFAGRPTLSEGWPTLRDALRQRASGPAAAEPATALAQPVEDLESMRTFLLLIGERSGLLLDPEANTYYLTELAVERVLPWADALGRLGSQGAALLAQGQVSAAERAAVLGRVEPLRRELLDVELRMAALRRAGEAQAPAFEVALARSRAFAERASALFGTETPAGEAGAFFDQGVAASNAVNAFARQIDSRLFSELGRRLAGQQRQLAMQVGAGSAGLVLLLYFSAAFYLSFLGALHRLSRGMGAVADGNLAHRFDVDGRDEMADIGHVVERMADRLSTMVAEIRSSAVRVSSTGQRLAGGNAALAERTEHQAGNLRQFVATVGQMSSAVAANADEVHQLDDVTAHLHTQAEQGGQAMAETIGALGALEASSKRVSEIVSVIDGIAFQTNILALNAAVEAARADESGRGFAVVAAEVRQLAQRSGAAAGEIRQLIGQSREQVDSTVKRVQHTGGTLQAVVSGVRGVSERLRGIATASAEQSQGLQEMAAAVGNLDEITRQNAAMVEESQQSAQSLVGRAAALAEAVASIRLRQGSADEACALVKRAVELIARQGRQGADAALHSAEQGFVDRDLYVFLIDRQGHYRLHGAKPAMEGKRVHEVPGIDGDRFVHDVWAAAESGGGWVEYQIINGVTGQIQPKASWVQQLDSGLIIGCGVYRQNAQQPQRDAAAHAPPPATRPALQPA